MRQYVIRRLVLSGLVVFFVVLLVFLLVSAMPGDVIDSRLAGTGMSQDQIDAYKEEIGLNDPLPVQFLRWTGDLARGDLGESAYTGRSVSSDLRERLLPTIELGVLALLLGFLIAVPLGTISAVKPNSPVDYSARFVARLGLAIPEFVLALVAILILSKWAGYFPPLGFTSPSMTLSEPTESGCRYCCLEETVSRYRPYDAILLLEVLRADYIRTARSKGLLERAVVFRHALKNASIPILAIVAASKRGDRRSRHH
jgi:peptide/nickel transport system permease protein